MATVSVVVAPATVTGALVSCGRKIQKKMNKVVDLNGLNSYGGLKAQNKLVSLGQPVRTERCFANFANALKTTGRGGGALFATCDAASEIFKIAAIMNGLVLVGVAVGFVLLKIEAAFEETE